MPILFQCVNRILAYSPLKITKSPALSFRTQGNMLAMNPLLVEIGRLKQILNIAPTFVGRIFDLIKSRVLSLPP